MKSRNVALGSRARGFTLVELMVSLVGGLFVSLAVFAMARDASRFYQREGRLANATLAAVVGFERLRADIGRAGFLVTPNVRTDPMICSRPEAGSNTLFADMAAVRIGISEEGSPKNDLLTGNGLSPHRLILAGSYSSPDEFVIRSVEQDSQGYRVYLRPDSAAMARLGWSATDVDTANKARLETVFAPGRGLRIVDTEGRQHYGLITGVLIDAESAPPKPVITLSSTLALQFRESTGGLCGLKGSETGARASVVNFIQYELSSLKDLDAYKPLYQLSLGNNNKVLEDYETNRTDLIRTELDATDKTGATALTLNGTPQRELVSEYAVNLEFEVTADTTVRTNLVTGQPPPEPTLSHFIAPSKDFITYTSRPSIDARPERLRSLRARLSVRSREPDREGGMPPGLGPGLYRLALSSKGNTAFARVRTLQADVMLNNLSDATW